MTTAHLIRNLQAIVTNAKRAERQAGNDADIKSLVAVAKMSASDALHIAQAERSLSVPRKVYRGRYRGPV